MTAEKETDHMLPKAAGWGAPPLHTQQSPVPKHARPIVKGNTGGNMNMNTYQPSPDYSSAAYVNHIPQVLHVSKYIFFVNELFNISAF